MQPRLTVGKIPVYFNQQRIHNMRIRTYHKVYKVRLIDMKTLIIIKPTLDPGV